MTRRSVMMLVVALVGAASAGAASPAQAATQRPATPAAASAGTWTSARELAGGLNTGGDAGLFAASCSSAGNCAAGGYYQDSSGRQVPLLASEVNGTWQPVGHVPGIATLDVGPGEAQVTSVSCPSAGFELSCRAATSCSGGGTYSDGSSVQQALVITEATGVWSAQDMAGALNLGDEAQVDSVSCSAPGNCGAGGYYSDSSGFGQAFVVTQAGGTWGVPTEVPGAGTLNKLNAQVSAISCPSAGNCSAGGNYGDSSGKYQAFVATESGGTWGAAKEAPGTGTLNKTGSAMVTAIACHSAGNCSAGGYYSAPFSRVRSFVIGEAKGTWGSAKEVASGLNAGNNGAVSSVSCGSAGNCTAGGYYLDGSGNQQAFEVGQSAGTWGKAAQVPGTGSLNAGGSAALTSVSCKAAGVCLAAGYYTDKSGRQQAFTASEG